MLPMTWLSPAYDDRTLAERNACLYTAAAVLFLCRELKNLNPSIDTWASCGFVERSYGC